MALLFYALLAAGALAAVYLFNTYRAFRVNLEDARKSGLPYVCLPLYPFNPLWLVTHKLWLPILELLPKAWTESWIEHMSPDFIWETKYDAFRKMGADAFMVVAPAANTIYVADAETTAQITARRNDFPKPTWIYKSVDLYGKNVVSSEGAMWRHHRKITSPPFTEKNNYLVWQESLHQARSMMTGWTGLGREVTKPLKDVAAQTMRLSLHVISRAGFGVRLDWPHEEKKQTLPPGHTLSYKDAMSGLLDNIIVIMLTPRLILNYSPFKLHKEAREAFSEWTKYMHEMYQQKREEVLKGASADAIGMDLLGTLVRGAGFTSESSENDGRLATDPEKQTPPAGKQMLSTDEILGNAFVFILAGHETVANTINFSILSLAMHMDSQRHLQEDLDSILGNKSTESWDYNIDMPKLFGSMCGAVMNETLRMVPPVIGIPKVVSKHSPQALMFSGQSITAPQSCNITINTVGLHRNPKYWPHTSEQDLNDFRPERWLLDPTKSNSNLDEDTYATEEGLDFEGLDKRPDTAATLFRPPKSAYVPFSDGYRSCLGRRFAQVQLLAVLSVIFKQWSVELDVSDWLSDKDLETATEQQKRDAWNKADARARDLLDHGMISIITLQMRKDQVPLRFVKRGKEHFNFA